MHSHDPLQFAASLSVKLAARSRHVCLFLGAGTSCACGLPGIPELEKSVLKALDGSDKAAFEKQLIGRNLEEALSRLRRIAALLDGDQQIDDLTQEAALRIDRRVCESIVNALMIDNANLNPPSHLASWISRANYHYPVELFTVNYDLLFETALDTLGVPYFDGFVGNLQALFRTDLVEAGPKDRDWVPSFFMRLWKLHGSVNWTLDEKQQIVRLGASVSGQAAAIYPSDAKYEESRRMPFIVLQDRLRRALNQPETIFLVSGYSFGDEHLNELFFDAAKRRERSEIVVFCHSTIPAVLAEHAADTPNLQVVSPKEAIIGGIRSQWVSPPIPGPKIWDNDSFALCDFGNLASYLARSGTPEVDREKVLPKVVSNVPNEQEAKSGDAT